MRIPFSHMVIVVIVMALLNVHRRGYSVRWQPFGFPAATGQV